MLMLTRVRSEMDMQPGWLLFPLFPFKIIDISTRLWYVFPQLVRQEQDNLTTEVDLCQKKLERVWNPRKDSTTMQTVSEKKETWWKRCEASDVKHIFPPRKTKRKIARHPFSPKAETLITSLGGEKTRWTQNAIDLAVLASEMCCCPVLVVLYWGQKKCPVVWACSFISFLYGAL